jgi:hypothetical protein
MVDLDDAGRALQAAPHGRRVDAHRDGVESEIGGIAQKTPCAPNNDRVHNEARHRVDPMPTREQDREAREHNASRHDRIRRHVKKRAFDVEIVLAAAQEEESSARVDRDPDGGNPDYRTTGHRSGFAKATNRLPGNPANCDEQKNGVGQRSKNR